MIELLKSFTDKFCKLNEDELGKLINPFATASIKKKGFILEEGVICNKLFFITKGIVRSYYVKDGEEITSNFYFAPTFLSDIISYKKKEPTMLNLQFLEDGEYLSSNFDDVVTLGESTPRITQLFLKFYEHLYMVGTERQLSFIFDNAEQRYLKLFTERPKVIASVPQQFIASYLGIKRETLSRIRKKIVL